MIKILSIISIAIALSGCNPSNNKKEQAAIAKQAAESIVFTENSEIENIKRRLELTSKVNAIGYIVLLNDAGQPILYTTVKGKVTSGSKRLTREDEYISGALRKSASDEGTYGSSNPYIYFWSTNGTYHQWSGQYLYSDKPIRLRVEPLVIEVK
jgi:hypothetical protein